MLRKTVFWMMLALLISMLTLTLAFKVQIRIKTVDAQPPTTVLKINPSNSTIGQEGQPIPTMEPVTLSIEVENVMDLFSWQVVLCYNESILNTREDWMWLPPDHVFYGKDYIASPTVKGSDAQGSFIQKSVSLQSLNNFTGSGILCKINFTAAGIPGISNLNFTNPIGSIASPRETYLLDPDIEYIQSTAAEGTVEVKGTASVKEPSIITISADQAFVYLGYNVTIRGNVTLTDGTPKANVDVAVYYRVPETPGTPFTILGTVKTDGEGHYNYTWTPQEGDLYGRNSTIHEFKASWLGDETTNGNQSEIITILAIIPEFPSHAAVLFTIVLITSVVIVTRKKFPARHIT